MIADDSDPYVNDLKNEIIKKSKAIGSYEVVSVHLGRSRAYISNTIVYGSLDRLEKLSLALDELILRLSPYSRND